MGVVNVNVDGCDKSNVGFQVHSLEEAAASFGSVKTAEKLIPKTTLEVKLHAHLFG